MDTNISKMPKSFFGCNSTAKYSTILPLLPPYILEVGKSKVKVKNVKMEKIVIDHNCATSILVKI